MPAYLPQKFKKSLQHLAVMQHHAFTDKYQQAKERLAFIQHLQCKEDIKKVNDLCAGFEVNNELYIEASRLIIDDTHRNILLSSFFIAGIFSLGKLLNLEYFFLSCTHHHAAFYKKFGLALLPYEAEYGTSLQPKKQVVFGTYLSTVDLSKTTFKDSYSQLQAEGKITLQKAA